VTTFDELVKLNVYNPVFSVSHGFRVKPGMTKKGVTINKEGKNGVQKYSFHG
jgi:hypothetical protein